MPKKVIDIVPPKSAGSSSESREAFGRQVLTAHSVKTIKRDGRGFSVSKRSILKRTFGVIFLFLILGLAALQFFFSEADIKISPATEAFNSSGGITVDIKAGRPDFNAKLIPGKIFEVENTVSDEFSAEGKILKKSGGVIRLYNSYTTQAETWVQGTRFVSSEGKLFLSKDRIRVPGAAIKNGKVEPSFVDVPVMAAQAGQEYNISPSNFSIAAFGGTARFTKYYGESLQSMSGGGGFPQVTEDDLQRAENVLIDRAKTEADAKLKEKIPETFVFLASAQQTEILEKSSSADAGSETEKFTFQVKTKSTAIAFELKDMAEFVNSMILSQIPTDKKLHQESLKTEYQTQALDPEAGRMVASLKVWAKIYPEINFDSLKKVMAGKSLREGGALLSNMPELSHSEIKVFPFWLQSFPKELDKIKIELRVD